MRALVGKCRLGVVERAASGVPLEDRAVEIDGVSGSAREHQVEGVVEAVALRGGVDAEGRK